ncbi:MAG: hypothetical protein ACJ72P_09815, partial [Nocardioides sp.]
MPAEDHQPQAAQRTVVLHVGLMKSGTTFVQKSLFENKQALGEQGVLVPGTRWSKQAAAVQDVLRPRSGTAK